MSYNTHAFPNWGSLKPKLGDDATEYEQTASWALKDIFGEYQDIDRPERDAPRFAKITGIYAARAIDQNTKERTLGEIASIISDRMYDFAEEREVTELEVTPQVLATAVYAEQVRSLDWGAEQLGDEWDENALVLVHDNLRELKEIGKEGQNG